jgi:hypothetical protein
LIALLAAIMASAMLRMRLYVEHFGLTTDRLFATAFMTWLAVVFVAMALTVLRGWTRPFAAISMLSGFATLFLLNVVNPEELVARVNVHRAGVGEVDYAYLGRLSGDAMPTVVEALGQAPASPGACNAAKAMRLRWARPQEAAWNVGARRGPASVREHLSPTTVLRLCAGVPAAPQ